MLTTSSAIVHSFGARMPKPPSVIAKLIATTGGIGYLPIAPGTWCSAIVGLPALLGGFGMWWVYPIAAVVASGLAWWSVGHVQHEWGTDPQRVVMDEAAGMCIVCSLAIVQHSMLWWLAGFLVFRAFDIAKPWPLNIINDRHEAWAVVADDVLAAGYTVGTLLLAQYGLNAIVFALKAA